MRGANLLQIAGWFFFLFLFLFLSSFSFNLREGGKKKKMGGKTLAGTGDEEMKEEDGTWVERKEGKRREERDELIKRSGTCEERGLGR